MVVPPPSRSDVMVKAAMRAGLRARRDAFVTGLDETALVGHAASVAERLGPAFRKARCIAAYAPLGSEFPILPALAHAASLGIPTALPHVTHRDTPMIFRAWMPGTILDKGYFGLSQPETGRLVIPDLILMPLLGFDRALQRLGQGAGFYDRWLAAHPEAIRIGIAWRVQEEPHIPVDAWDVPLHAIITETEWIGPQT